ncbi:peptidase inhibitor family I36 protein [Lentzea sp. DG1S-22]|uniref:peptidase inhibitor family I36 protein n=1 Tax=Lentzea sp. DG1S-22 TaxID=3108822 RepID=UPI002E79AEDC|nr:peptidase inhibitor family I36 protein [Lentzea sp. DG1S-22]WVH77904.1 peptidase inhibitor family I36 protein [Lentzea sp. DG1S-22]
MLKKLTFVTLMGALVSASFGAGVANAADRDGSCDSGEFCLYYNSDQAGSVSDFTGSVADYGDSQPSCYEFKGAGSGKGVCVKNNAASVWNKTNKAVTVFYNSNYGGAKQTFAAGAKGNLKAELKNENASHRFGDAGGDPDPAPGTYPAPETNPHPEATARAPQATKRTQFIDDQIASKTGEKQCWVGDYRSYESSTSNHNTGNALDCTISDAIGTYPTAAQKAQGWKLAYWLQKHAGKLDVRYVIWQGKIWSVARASEGWRNYTAGTGVTAGHYDHVHVSVQNPHGD